MHATITESKEKKGEYGVEIGNGKDVAVAWTSLAPYEETDHTLRDVILLLGFDVMGTWQSRNKVSRALVRQVKKTETVKPLDSAEPTQEEFLE